jgi:putative tributyrin esterase
MALLTCDFFSDALQVGTSMTVVLPQRTEEQIGVTGGGSDGPPPLLYLLHGLSDDHTTWHRYTAIGRYAEKAGLAVVMPTVHRSFYTNEAQGHRYWDFVSEELPGIVHEFLRVTGWPEETFVAGLSMGGYGALKLALTHPERYAAAASLSGGLELRQLLLDPHRADLLDRVFGGTVSAENDVFTLLQQASGVPPLYLGCGTEDPLLPGTRRFADDAIAAGLDVTLDLRPGTHEWSLWDAMIPDVIAWLPLPGPPEAENAEQID